VKGVGKNKYGFNRADMVQYGDEEECENGILVIYREWWHRVE